MADDTCVRRSWARKASGNGGDSELVLSSSLNLRSELLARKYLDPSETAGIIYRAFSGSRIYLGGASVGVFFRIEQETMNDFRSQT